MCDIWSVYFSQTVIVAVLKSVAEETASGDCNSLRTVVCVCVSDL
jgi:hypothetical protein